MTTLQKLYKFFLVLGLAGLIEIASRQFNIIQGTDIGIIALITLFSLGWIFGADIASFIATILSGTLSFALLYLIAAFFLRRKIQNTNTKSKKWFKVTTFQKL